MRNTAMINDSTDIHSAEIKFEYQSAHVRLQTIGRFCMKISTRPDLHTSLSGSHKFFELKNETIIDRNTYCQCVWCLAIFLPLMINHSCIAKKIMCSLTLRLIYCHFMKSKEKITCISVSQALKIEFIIHLYRSTTRKTTHDKRITTHSSLYKPKQIFLEEKRNIRFLTWIRNPVRIFVLKPVFPVKNNQQYIPASFHTWFTHLRANTMYIDTHSYVNAIDT